MGVISTWLSSGNRRQISSATPAILDPLRNNAKKGRDNGRLTRLDLLPVSANLDGLVVVPGIVQMNHFGKREVLPADPVYFEDASQR